ncbi:MAG: hypothetical protein JOZ24_02805 [Candidatus Eremiobacteraeota bacterium]|nr:hypothetical protein [Candidatus Eremiobacteraeota bacterium]
MELIRPAGDVYNERTSDGDSYGGTIGARATLTRGDLALSMQYWHNVYRTESAGAGSLTRYARLEGGYGTVMPFTASESSFEARVERRLWRAVPLYAGLGGITTWTNYGYPALTGAGLGLELRPTPSSRPQFFASAFYYPAALGSYVTESPPARTLGATFAILKTDFGAVVHARRSPIYVVVGFAFESRSGRNLPGDVRFIRSDPYIGIGFAR